MRGKSVLAMILALLLLTACGVQNAVVPTVTTDAVIPETSPSQETTGVTLPQVALEAVNELVSQPYSEGMEVQALDDRTVAFISVADKQTRVLLIDLYTDTVLTETTLEGVYTPVTSFARVLALGSEQLGQILLLDSALREITAMDVKNMEGILATETTYYYISGSRLYCADLSSGDVQRVTLTQELPLVEILEFDPQSNIMMCTAFVNPYTVGTCPAAIDLDTNSFVLLNSGFVAGGLTEDGFYLQGTEELQIADVSYGRWLSEQCSNLEDFLANNNRYSTWHVPGTNYLYRLTYDKTQLDTVTKAELYRMGDTLEVCQLPDPLDTVRAKKVVQLPDGNLLVIAMNRRNCRLYLICPDQLNFTEALTPQTDILVALDEGVYEDYQQSAVTQEVAQQLREVRQTADELEAEYGVTILMSNQCEAAAQSSGNPITTTDQAGLQDEARWIDGALDELESALELYPENFFRQFQNEAQERGILILLVEDISHDLNAIGICYTMGDWSIVAVDITSGEVFRTFCHEFWHATEFKIEQEDPTLLGKPVWDACNPEDFLYTYDTTPGYINDVENTLFNHEKNGDIYFIDPYAKTNPYEDRARLMEYVMVSDHYAERIMQIKALRNKLEIMAEAVRQVFNTDGWDVPYWERNF